MSDAYDPNELLGIAPDASEDDIRKAFRRKAKLVHPDVSDAPDAAEQFTQLKAAHDLLIERLTQPATSTSDHLYRPAKPVSKEAEERIIQMHRRRREAEQRRRARRRQAVHGNARRAERQNERFREEMAQRRAEYELAEREREREEERERARRHRERLEEERRIERERQEREERERKAQAQEQARQEEQRRQRAQQEEASRARREPQPISRAQRQCAWKHCAETANLSEPVETALGLRQFCRAHLAEYRTRNARQRRTRGTARRR